MVVVDLKPWETVRFEWGAGVRHRGGEWATAILNGGQEIDLEALEMEVVLHDNGIEFKRG